MLKVTHSILLIFYVVMLSSVTAVASDEQRMPGPGESRTALSGYPSQVRMNPPTLLAASGSAKAAGTSPGPAVDASYRIGIGDVLFISVWKDESLTQQVTVLPDGTISFPLIGEITVNELSLSELKAELSKRLARYIADATISVQAIQLNSQVVYIVGKVNHPGRFMLLNNINVLQALAMAGGLNPYARSGRIRVFRQTPKGTRILPFDYDEVAKGRHLEQNIQLNRGDVIVVP